MILIVIDYLTFSAIFINYFYNSIFLQMRRNKFIQLIFLSLLLFFTQSSFAQVFINELDSDTPGVDDKEFVELRTLAPFTSLNGYVLVFFNGNPTASNANMSYYAIDLSGLTTDANGLVTLGCNAVSPVPDYIFSDNLIQNGEDAVAVYQSSIANFPTGTLATSTNLVHALAYDTSDPDAVGLMALLGIVSPQVQVNENENNAQDVESIQRKQDGTYEVKAPTPGAMNDGSGVQYNGLTIIANTANHDEGDTIHITITTQSNVTSNLNFNLSLTNGSFNTSDYSGNLSINIPVGMNSFTTVVTLVDDVLNEGDEELKIKFGVLPVGFNRLNDNVIIRVVDNDYTIDPWGTPLNPTYGVVSSTAPTGYYSSLNGKSAQDLKQALQDIIANPAVVRKHTYGDIIDILKEADHNPKNGNQVWLMYVEQPRAKLDFQNTGSNVGKWNREHIFPQSRGGFSNGTSDTAFGINVYQPTDANDIFCGHSDAHSLRAEDGPENSSRNNRDYGGGDYNGPTGTMNSWRGDVSRALFYMAVRYNALSLVSGNPNDTTTYKLGDLDSLLSWNISDPRDDFEMNRNNYIYTWQYNRNPFIDMPELANYIYGNQVGQTWYNPVGIDNIDNLDVQLYPNPANDNFTIDGINGTATVEIYDLLGNRLSQHQFANSITISIDLLKGVYVVKVNSYGKSAIMRLLVN